MSNEAELLRMLEPAVRPGGLPVPSHGRRVPIESRSFESLLEEVQGMAGSANAGHPADGGSPTSGVARGVTQALIAQLAQVDRIENDSMRRAFGDRPSTANRPVSEGSSQTRIKGNPFVDQGSGDGGIG